MGASTVKGRTAARARPTGRGDSRPPLHLRPIASACRLQDQIDEALSKLGKTRYALVELTKGHPTTVTAAGVASAISKPCLTKRDESTWQMTRLTRSRYGVRWWSDNELTSIPDPERRLRRIYPTRDRWLEVLVMFTKDHMNEDHHKKCGVCKVDDPWVKTAFLRVNRGIAWRVANEFYVMDDEELRSVFHCRPRYDYAHDDEEGTRNSHRGPTTRTVAVGVEAIAVAFHTPWC